MNDDVIHTVFDLLNIECDSCDSRRSILSEKFVFKRRLIGNRDYDLDIADTDSLREFKKNFFERQGHEFKEKVWAHRVNSIEKLKEAIEIFNGLELDVIFLPEKGVFDISHSPSESIGLNLEHYLESIDNPGKYKFWLDFKNLNNENIGKAHKRLLFMTEKFNLVKENIIVESANPLLLKPFKYSGFYTSYYLPTDILKKVTKKRYKNLTEEEMTSIKRIIDKYKISAIDAVSTDSRFYSFVKKYLSDAKAVLLWADRLEHHRVRDFRKIIKILSEDKKIKVLLIKFESAYDR